MTKRQGCHRYECQRGRSLERSVGILLFYVHALDLKNHFYPPLLCKMLFVMYTLVVTINIPCVTVLEHSCVIT